MTEFKYVIGFLPLGEGSNRITIPAIAEEFSNEVESL